MNLTKTFSVFSFILGACVFAVLAIGLFLYLPEANVDKSLDVQNRLAVSLFARASTSKVEMYKDRNIMHGPIYYYFKPTDTGSLVQWLQLKPHRKVPDDLGLLIKHARLEVNWPFNWETQNVFVIYNCRGNETEPSFDMLLVDGTKVVYATDGYSVNREHLEDDPSLCLKTRK